MERQDGQGLGAAPFQRRAGAGCVDVPRSAQSAAGRQPVAQRYVWVDSSDSGGTALDADTRRRINETVEQFCTAWI